MRIFLIVLVMICALPLMLNSQTETPIIKQEQKAKITFIELGSVKCIPCKMMQPVMEEIELTYLVDTID